MRMKSTLRSLKGRLRNDPDDKARFIFESEDDAFGLKELAPGHDPVIDIVAVHGLNGHRERSWTDDENGILWLRDLLPYRFPNARILTFGYDAAILKLSEVSHLALNDYGTSLIVDLLHLRRDSESQRRPIIFLAHSLGGIVVKHALVTCDSARRGHNEEYRSIKVSTYGIAFFGTPHAGANSAEFQKILHNIGRIFISGNRTVLQLLRRDSEYLRYLTELYSPISSLFETIIFYEEFNTPLSKGTSIMVVPKISAVAPEAVNTIAVALHKHHIDLVKYNSEQDRAFQTVLSHIGVVIKSALQKVTERWQQEMKMKKIDDQRLAKFSLRFDLPPRNLQFTGRTKELLWLSDIVRDADIDECQVAVLYGPGGIGKTEIVAQYAWQTRATYTSILWIHAATAEVMNRSFMSVVQNLIQHLAVNLSPEQPDYAAIADDLEIPGLIDASGQLVYHAGSDDQERIVGALIKWLTMEGNDKWMLIFDNVNDMNVIDRARHFPQSGTIIITSQSWESAQFGTGSYQVEGMNQDDAITLLMTKAHLDWRWLSATECEEAMKIVEELGYVPLAIEQAGAYMWSQGSTLDGYMKEYKRNFQRVAEYRHKGLEEYASVYTTWHMNLDAIRTNNLQAVQILLLYGFLSNDVSDEIILYGQERPTVGENRTSQLRTCIELLLSYSLVKRNSSKHRVWIHPIVHQWICQHLTTTDKLQQTEYALGVIARSIAWNSGDQAVERKSTFFRDILPDVITCVQNAIEYLQDQPTIKHGSWKSFMIVREFLESHGHYRQSSVLAEFLKSKQGKYLG